ISAATRCPRSTSRSAKATCAPSAMKRRTVASPIPEAPPVTAATFPLSCPIDTILLCAVPDLLRTLALCYCPALIKSAQRSAIIIVVTLVLARTTSGMMEASATRKPKRRGHRPGAEYDCPAFDAKTLATTVDLNTYGRCAAEQKTTHQHTRPDGEVEAV